MPDPFSDRDQLEAAIDRWSDPMPEGGTGSMFARPAIVNWQTQTGDVDLLIDVTRELAQAELSWDRHG